MQRRKLLKTKTPLKSRAPPSTPNAPLVTGERGGLRAKKPLRTKKRGAYGALEAYVCPSCGGPRAYGSRLCVKCQLAAQRARTCDLCEHPHYAKGLCRIHYYRRNRSDPTVLRKGGTHCKYGHEFTIENTIIMPSGKRRCRQCWGKRKARHAHLVTGRTKTWPLILERVAGRCEGCGRSADAQWHLEWAHIFGRPSTGGRLGPLANSIWLTTALCSGRFLGEYGCHETIDRAVDLKLRERLRWSAVERLAAAAGLDVPESDDAMQAVRQLARQVLFDAEAEPYSALKEAGKELP